MYENKETILRDVSARENIFLKRVYLWMFAGLVLTAAVAFFVAQSATLLRYVATNPYSIIVICLVELGLVFFLSARVEKMSVGSAIACFLGYSALNGVTFSTIVAAFLGSGIIEKAFLSTAIVFGVAAVYGTVTKKSVRSWGSWLFVALIGIIFATLLNLIFRSEMIDYVISIAGVVIFSGLTAWDSNKLASLNRAYGSQMNRDELSKISIMGALDLYLDFINIFLYFIRIFANSRDN